MSVLLAPRARIRVKASTVHRARPPGKYALPVIEAEDVFRSFQLGKKEIEVLGMVGRDYQIALTDLGSRHAQDRLGQSRYAGAASSTIG